MGFDQKGTVVIKVRQGENGKWDVNETGFEKVRHVRTYPYRHNLFILPASLPTSLHGVSPRARTWRPRYHLHIVGEMSGRLFDIPRAPANAGAERLAAP